MTRNDAVNGWLDFLVDTDYLMKCIEGKAVKARELKEGKLRKEILTCG